MVTDFPEPLSPTITSVSPCPTCRDTPRTARSRPLGSAKDTERFLIYNTFFCIIAFTSMARIKYVAKAIPQQIQPRDEQRKRHAREDGIPGCKEQVVLAH